MSFLAKFQDFFYAIMRIVMGFLFACHGTQKLFGFPIEFPYDPLTPLTTSAAIIELVAGLLIMLGLLVRPAAFLASGTMAVGYWMAHGLQNPFPIANGGEIAAMFCFVFLYISARGPGILSLGK